MSSTYIDGFAVNETTQGICNTQYKSETNMTIEFTTEHDKILTDMVFTAHMKFINVLANKFYFEF